MLISFSLSRPYFVAKEKMNKFGKSVHISIHILKSTNHHLIR